MTGNLNVSWWATPLAVSCVVAMFCIPVRGQPAAPNLERPAKAKAAAEPTTTPADPNLERPAKAKAAAEPTATPQRNENPWPASFPKSLVERLASQKGWVIVPAAVPANAKVQELPDRFEITAAPWRTVLVDGKPTAHAHSKLGIHDTDHDHSHEANLASPKDEHRHDAVHKPGHARDAGQTHNLWREEYSADEGKLIVSKDKDQEISWELTGNASFEGGVLSYSAQRISMHSGGKNPRLILSGNTRFANSRRQSKLSADTITSEEQRLLLEGNARMVRRDFDSALPEQILADRIELDTATNTMNAN